MSRTENVITIAIALFLSFFLPCMAPQAGEFSPAPTTQYQLDNGMKIILKENHASPMISSIVCVGAGSKYENEHNNGFSHFLEHLLFDGTASRSRIDINEGIKNYGGYINAFTRKEVTTFFILMPREFIEEGLAIQSDQLFASAFPEEEYEKERKVVIEEIKKEDDDLDYRVEKFHDGVVYGNSPYALPVIGNAEVISSIAREKVIDYWKSHYIPNNMTLLLIGDFETKSMKKLVEKYFGRWESRPLPPGMEVRFNFSPTNSTEILRFPTKVTNVNISYMAPHFSDRDYYVFEIIAQMLDAKEASPLYKALTERDPPLATTVSAYQETQKEFSLLHVSVTAGEKADVETIVTTVNAVIRGFTQDRFTPEDVSRFIVKSKANEYYLEDKLHFYAFMKAQILQNCGYDFIASYLDNLSEVGPRDIPRIARKYFSGLQYSATAVIPE
jgi:zinc protease